MTSSEVRSALVTGATGGIGRAIVGRLSKSGWNVLAVDLVPTSDLGVPFVGADLATREGNQIAVNTALERFGRLDLVVPNAGLQHIAPLEDYPEDRWDAMTSLMLTSPFLLAKYAWEALRSAPDGGRFVVIGSVASLVASPFTSGYVAAKHGVLGLVKTLALEGARHRITATAVCPGFVRTPMLEEHITKMATEYRTSEEQVIEDVALATQAVKRLIEPEEVADVVAFLTTPAGATFTGVPMTMDMGRTAQ